MFTAEDIQAKTRRQPFQPFRIVTTSGQSFDIMYPDMAMALVNRVIVNIPTVCGAQERPTELAPSQIADLLDLILTAVPAAKNNTN